MDYLKNKLTAEIAEFVRIRLVQNGGFCGVASNTGVVVLNGSDGNGSSIKVKIEIGLEV